jgi:cobalt/nickel transport system permease protein
MKRKKIKMHIPDGYLSLPTCAAGYIIAAPLWFIGLRKIKKVLDEKTLPLLASLTAFSFIIMMFNVPIPGGTSGHATGAALLAIVFDPWVAYICVSLVLLIQALLFGDGGITTYGINTLGMGAVGSFVAYGVFHKLKSLRFAPFIAGWISLVSASALVAFVLGIQPLIAHGADGKPLYFPFGLDTTFPALVGSHMLFFGIVEGVFTQIAYKYIIKKDFIQ